MSGLGDIWRVIWQSLTLDWDLWRDLVADPNAVRFRFALLIVVLAGFSEAVAQSVVLFLNQVRLHRFIASLLINAVLFTFGYAFYVLSINLVARVLYGAPRPSELVFDSIALAYAPLVLSFLSLIPYFGRGVGIVLSVYHVLALLIAVRVTFALEPPAPVVCVAVGWVLLTLLSGTVGRPITLFARFLRHRFAGKSLLDREELRRRYRARLAQGDRVGGQVGEQVSGQVGGRVDRPGEP